MGNAFYGEVNDMASKILLKAKSSDLLFFLHGKSLVQSYSFPDLPTFIMVSVWQQLDNI